MTTKPVDSVKKRLQIMNIVLFLLGSIFGLSFGDNMHYFPVGQPGSEKSYKQFLKNDWRLTALYSNLMDSTYLPNFRPDMEMFINAKELPIAEVIDPFKDLFSRDFK